MSYRTILVHLDQTARCAARSTLAGQWARAHEAHLIGLVPTGLYDGVIPASDIVAGTTEFLEQSAQFLRMRAEGISREFSVRTSQEGALSYEVRLVDTPAVDATVRHGRTSDLVVLGQHEAFDQLGVSVPDLAQRVVVEVGRPVLVVPFAGEFSGIARHVVVAWDGSRESATALRAAVPAMQRASKVTILGYTDVDDEEGEEGEALLQEADLLQFLTRHGIRAQADRQVKAADINVADAMLSRIYDLGGDLLVMGCYGHSRFRELMLGGVTRQILTEMTVPVLMAH